MKKAIIGKKVGMTQIFDEMGKVIPVTVIRSRRQEAFQAGAGPPEKGRRRHDEAPEGIPPGR